MHFKFSERISNAWHKTVMCHPYMPLFIQFKIKLLTIFRRTALFYISFESTQTDSFFRENSIWLSFHLPDASTNILCKISNNVKMAVLHDKQSQISSNVCVCVYAQYEFNLDLFKAINRHRFCRTHKKKVVQKGTPSFELYPRRISMVAVQQLIFVAGYSHFFLIDVTKVDGRHAYHTENQHRLVFFSSFDRFVVSRHSCFISFDLIWFHCFLACLQSDFHHSYLYNSSFSMEFVLLFDLIEPQKAASIQSCMLAIFFYSFSNWNSIYAHDFGSYIEQWPTFGIPW